MCEFAPGAMEWFEDLDFIHQLAVIKFVIKNAEEMCPICSVNAAFLIYKKNEPHFKEIEARARMRSSAQFN